MPYTDKQYRKESKILILFLTESSCQLITYCLTDTPRTMLY